MGLSRDAKMNHMESTVLSRKPTPADVGVSNRCRVSPQLQWPKQELRHVSGFTNYSASIGGTKQSAVQRACVCSASFPSASLLRIKYRRVCRILPR